MFRVTSLIVVLTSVTACLASEIHSEKPHTEIGLVKVDAALIALLEEFQAFQENRSADKPFKTSQAELQVIDDRVAIDAVAMEDGTALATQLLNLGAEGVATSGLYVSFRLPIPAIEYLAEVESLRFARPVFETTR